MISLGSTGKLAPTKQPSLLRSTRVVLQTELEAGDLAGLTVAKKPVVGVAAVITVEHDPDEVVDRPAVLQGLACAG